MDESKRGTEWWAGLSSRQKEDEVEALMKQGLTNKEILDELALKSIGQVAGIRARLVKKHPKYAGGSNRRRPRTPYVPPVELSPEPVFTTRLGKPQQPTLSVIENEDYKTAEEREDEEKIEMLTQLILGTLVLEGMDRPFFQTNHRKWPLIRRQAAMLGAYS